MDANQQLIIGIAIVAIIVLLAVFFMMRQRRTAVLRDTYGEEYDRTVDARGGVTKAEADLIERKKRVEALTIRPLSHDERDRFSREWTEAKALFVDSPAEATMRADRLLGRMMETRGYPMADFDHRYEDLTVNHADVARHYREGHMLSSRQEAGQANTEDLRQAMQHYEALFDRLVHDAGPGEGAGTPLNAGQPIVSDIPVNR